MDYKLIIFDLGNVVVKFNHNISAGKIANHFGLNRERVYNLFFDSKITQLHDEGRLSSRNFYYKVKKILNIDIEFIEFKDYWNDIFFIDDDIAELIKRLKKRYKVYLMSNTNKLHFDFIKNKFDVIKEFDKVILSFKVGKRKPHSLIYKYALKLAKTTPQETIYIDDRPELAEGAKSIGIKAIIYKDLKQLRRELRYLAQIY